MRLSSICPIIFIHSMVWVAVKILLFVIPISVYLMGIRQSLLFLAADVNNVRSGCLGSIKAILPEICRYWEVRKFLLDYLECGLLEDGFLRVLLPFANIRFS